MLTSIWQICSQVVQVKQDGINVGEGSWGCSRLSAPGEDTGSVRPLLVLCHETLSCLGSCCPLRNADLGTGLSIPATQDPEQRVKHSFIACLESGGDPDSDSTGPWIP